MKPMTVWVAAAALCLVRPAWTQGYYVDEQSAKRLGDAFSGGAAEAEDASTAFYNPAGLTRLRQDELIVGMAAVRAAFDIDAQGESLAAVTGPDSVLGTPILGSGRASPDPIALIPHLYLAHPVTDRWALGLSLNTPYASGSEYDADFVGRYFSEESDILGVHLSLGTGFVLSDALSLGAGLNLQYLEGRIARRINTAGYCAGAESLGLLAEGACDASGIGPSGTGSSDGEFEVEGDDLGLGYTLGLLYQWSENTRLGFSFRSKIEHALRGPARFRFPANVEATIGGLGPDLSTRDTRAKVGITTPETASLSLYHRLSPRWTVQGDLGWTRWSRFKDFVVEIRDSGSRQTTPENWRDSWRLAVGTGYRLNDRWTLRAGLAYDRTPIPDETVSLDFPYADFKAVSVGFTYRPSPSLSIDCGLQHTLPFKRRMRSGSLAIDRDAASLSAEVETEIDSFALGLRWRY